MDSELEDVAERRPGVHHLREIPGHARLPWTTAAMAPGETDS
jgi:hypothetical protein